jgi:hypothetical protein
MSGTAGKISLWDVYQKLPHTIAYNLADSIQFDTTRVEWIYRQTGLLVRIPTSSGTRSWIYVFQPYDAPADIKVYAVKFYQESGTSTNFTGEQAWVDLQDWHGYAVHYTNNRPDGFLEPQKLSEPGWEPCMMDHGDFYLDNQGKIQFTDEQLPGTGMRPTGGSDGCGGMITHKSRKSFWDMLGGIFGSIFSNNPGPGGRMDFGSAPGVWIPPNGIGDDGYGGGSGGGGGASPYEPPPADPEINPVPPDQAGSSFNTIDDPGQTVPALWDIGGPLTMDGNNNQVVTVENATVAFVGGMLGLNQNQRNWLLQHLDKAASLQVYLLTVIPDLSEEEKKDVAKDHLTMMMQDQDYLNEINNLTVNWWDRDQEDLIIARKIQMRIYLQSHPYGMINCDAISVLPMQLYQDVGSYQVPQSVINRITGIRSQNTPTYTSSNFKIQDINDAAGGVIGAGRVNCDYFYVNISALPYQNGIQMTPDELLEYFRTHLNSFIGSNVNVEFEPYVHSVPPNVNINETAKFASSYENSEGAIIHIDMADDGTVVESGYSRNTSVNHHNFTFTTMKTPLDYSHPVAGNRRFGIFSYQGGYVFYNMGVDRTNDISTSLVNVANIAFTGADELWHSIQSNIQNYINTHSGSAPSIDERIARPNWNAVKLFLQGKRSLAQYKSLLNCP